MSSTVSPLSSGEFRVIAEAKAGLIEIVVLRDCVSEYGRPITNGSKAYARWAWGVRDLKAFTPEEYVFEVLAYKGDEREEVAAYAVSGAVYQTVSGHWKPTYGTMVSLSPFTSVDPPDEED